MDVETALALVLAVLPPAILVWYFHSSDHRPEPMKVVWTTFLLGALSPIPVLIVAYPLLLSLHPIRDPFLAGAILAFGLAAIPEEIVKFLVLRWYAARHRAFDEPMDGLVYGVIASLGFATSENLLYVLHGGIKVALLRALTAIPMHASIGAIMGSYLGQAAFDKNHRFRDLARALWIPILLHGLYDFPAMSLALANQHGLIEGMHPGTLIGLASMTLVTLAFVMVAASGRHRQLKRQQRESAVALAVVAGTPSNDDT